MVVTKSVDLSSPLLFQAVGAGTAFATALLDVTRTAAAQTQAYMKYELSDVFITSYSVSSGRDRPTESLSLNYTQVVFSYFPQLPNGALGDPIVGSITAVPEPSTWVVLAAGLLAVGLRFGRTARRG
jgi:type VI secretion system secreted protein Hcp